VSSDPAVAALQAALRAVNAAIYGYGVAGAQLPASQRLTAQQDWTGLQRDRDTLQGLLAHRGAAGQAAAAAYRLPFPVHTAHAAVSLAGYLEEQLSGAYLGLVGLEDAQLRAWGAQQAQGCAVRASAWLGRTLAFPGLTGAAVPAVGAQPRARAGTPPPGTPSAAPTAAS
jgi:Domain of unknown function (DUF4439)